MRDIEASSVITFRNVTKSYGKGSAIYEALRGVSLHIALGEFVAIMGPSGSGKSTALNILGCLDMPSSGQYLFEGVPVEALDRNQRTLLRRHRLGFIFQGFYLLPRTSAQENVELPLIYHGLPPTVRQAMAREALARVGLSDWGSHTPSELSGGQQQRVAIARALVTRPAVLLADEPTGNLDSARSHEIMKLLVELNETEKLTVVMVTHDPSMATYAQRLIHFSDGVIMKATEGR